MESGCGLLTLSEDNVDFRLGGTHGAHFVKCQSIPARIPKSYLPGPGFSLQRLQMEPKYKLVMAKLLYAMYVLWSYNGLLGTCSEYNYVGFSAYQRAERIFAGA